MQPFYSNFTCYPGSPEFLSVHYDKFNLTNSEMLHCCTAGYAGEIIFNQNFCIKIPLVKM